MLSLDFNFHKLTCSVKVIFCYCMFALDLSKVRSCVGVLFFVYFFFLNANEAKLNKGYS